MKKIGVFTSLIILIFVFGAIGYIYFEKLSLSNQEIIVNTNLITNSKFTLTLSESNYLDEVKPEAPVGFYNYYQKEENQKYLVVPVTIMNNSDNLIKSDEFQVNFKLKQKQYSGIFIIQDEEGTNFVNQIQPGESLKGALVTLVPSELSNIKESEIKLEFSSNFISGNKPFYYSIFR